MALLEISNHAMLRWLERVGGLDIPELKERLSIELDRAAEAADAIGVENYHIALDELTFVVRSGTVVTVLPGGGKTIGAKARAHRR